MKNKNIFKSFKYAFEGILTSLKAEKNMKIHIGVIFKINKAEWITCIILFAIVIAGEMFNTAIETVVDIAMPEINEKAKIAKDISAGAVLILAISSAIIGLIIFIPKLR